MHRVIKIVASNMGKFVMSVLALAALWAVLGGCSYDQVTDVAGDYYENDGTNSGDWGDVDQTAPPPTTAPCCPDKTFIP